MTGLEIGFVSLAAMLLLIIAGLHVPIALALTSFVGVWLLRGDPGLASRLIAIAAEESISSYLFGVVPLFVLMGLVVGEAGLGRDAFSAARRAFGRLRGGLGISTVIANAVFAAITGVSIASAAVFTRVAVPEMRRSGYHPRFAVGVVAGSSVLGMLIPPSLLLILYGLLSERSVGTLFLAGIGPGIVLTVAYSLAIVVMAYRFPGFVGGAVRPSSEPRAWSRDVAAVAPIGLLVGLVLGGIYGGVFTPTEAGAVGALGAMAVAFAKRRLPWRSLWKVALETGHVTGSICFLIIAASMYGRMLALSGVPAAMTAWIVRAELGVYGFLALYIVVLILLGAVLDSSSVMLVAVPLVLPIATQLGLDLVWFGIVTVIAIEIGLLTPPLGIAVYVIEGTLEDRSISLGDIFAGAAPFALIMLAVLVLVIAFPAVSLGLTRN